jgi:hypothetical protein
MISTNATGGNTMENKPTAIVRVHRPDLTPEEMAKRMEQIKRAAANLIVATRK